MSSPVSATPAGVWPLMRPVIGRIHLAMLLGALGAATALGSLAALALTLDALLRPALPLPAQPWPWLALAGGLAAAAFTARALAMQVSHAAAFDLELRLRSELAAHLAHLPLGYLAEHGAGALTKVLQDDVKQLHAFVADSTPAIGRGVAAPLAALALLLAVDGRLALVALATLALGLAAIRLALRDHVDRQRRYDTAREHIHRAAIEFVQAMPVVRGFDGGSASFGRYQHALDDFRAVLSQWLAASATSARLGLLLLGPLPMLLALGSGGLYWVLAGSLSPAAWVAALLLGGGMAESLLPLMWLAPFIRKADISARRIQALQAEPVLPPAPQPLCPADASVRFEDVSFAYAPSAAGATDADAAGAATVLRQVDFNVPAGTVTALVGPSGAGKSTVARLIPRFWDVTAGAIRIGGVDVRHMAPDTLMDHVAFVFQDSFLFHDSIADNIRLGRPDASFAQVTAAAQAAQAHDFILALPHGYDSIAGERGTRLSGGQRQRIAIARALLQDRPIVVLDEATAFADAHSEAALIAALSRLMRGRTAIVIAHRLATIRHADQIVVLDHGQVVEHGTHDALLARAGVYARLWHSHEHAQAWCLRQPPAGIAATEPPCHD